MSRAQWIQKTHLFCSDEYVCSMCGVTCAKPYKTCPSCGSVMRESKYDPSWVDEVEGLSAMVDDDW